MKIKNIVPNGKKWFSSAPEKALNRAYKAALNIKQIEDEQFKGQKISPENSDYGDSVNSYFQSELNKNLQIISTRLTIFKTSKFFFNLSGLASENPERKSIITNKLNFIDEIISKYDGNEETISDLVPPQPKVEKPQPQKLISDNTALVMNPKDLKSKRIPLKKKNPKSSKSDPIIDQTGVLPRSFLSTINRIKREIDPKSDETEEEVIKKFRKSRFKTALSIKFILILIIVPLLIHNLSKIVMVKLFEEPWFKQHQEVIFLNQNLEEEAIMELKHFEEVLRFRGYLLLEESHDDSEKHSEKKSVKHEEGHSKDISKESSKQSLEPSFEEPSVLLKETQENEELKEKKDKIEENLEEKLQEKAEELKEEFRKKGIDAIGNIFADLFSVAGFAFVIVVSREEVAVLKSFLDEMIYGLSDSAKAFLIILFTDIFVGFHSPHGWEIILEGVAKHFGLPESRDFNFLFIATFPVILDTVLKYWIFRYLNRISPSAVATYKNMNE